MPPRLPAGSSSSQAPARVIAVRPGVEQLGGARLEVADRQRQLHERNLFGRATPRPGRRSVRERHQARLEDHQRDLPVGPLLIALVSAVDRDRLRPEAIALRCPGDASAHRPSTRAHLHRRLGVGAQVVKPRRGSVGWPPFDATRTMSRRPRRRRAASFARSRSSPRRGRAGASAERPGSGARRGRLSPGRRPCAGPSGA